MDDIISLTAECISIHLHLSLTLVPHCLLNREKLGFWSFDHIMLTKTHIKMLHFINVPQHSNLHWYFDTETQLL